MIEESEKIALYQILSNRFMKKVKKYPLVSKWWVRWIIGNRGLQEGT